MICLLQKEYRFCLWLFSEKFLEGGSGSVNSLSELPKQRVRLPWHIFDRVGLGFSGHRFRKTACCNCEN